MEHTGSTALIAMVLSDYFNSIGMKNNSELVLRIAIVHDLDEVVSGDMPHDAKYQLGSFSESLRSALNKLSESTFLNMVKKVHKFDTVNTQLCVTYGRYKSKATIEAKIVKLADFLDVYLFSENELAAGNTHIITELKNSHKRFIALLEEVVRYYGK